MRKLSPTTVIALVALFVALGGVGLAANGQSLILGQGNSATLQTGLSSNTSSATFAITNSSTGSPLKLQGSTSTSPLILNSSTKVANLNSDKLDGIDSTQFLPGGNLPSGTTIRGVYRAQGLDDSALFAGNAASAISFGFSLASAPTPHVIPKGGVAPASCPGSATNPQAVAGHLCVYEATRSNIGTLDLHNPVTGISPGATKWGTSVLVSSAADGFFWSGGSWAVTAP